MNRQYLHTQITVIEMKRNNIEWLTPYLSQADKIANFGCELGAETLALMWLLQAQEAVGLDIEIESIDQARENLHGLKEASREANDAMNYSWTSEEDRRWWSQKPAFFKIRIHEPDFSVHYLCSDITRRTNLEDASYDLAYCDHVLHDILRDVSREGALQDTQFVINEMTRVVKPGGTVAACELVQFNDEERLDFAQLFERAGLNRIYVKEEDFEGLGRKGWVGRYVYRKDVSDLGNGI